MADECRRIGTLRRSRRREHKWLPIDWRGDFRRLADCLEQERADFAEVRIDVAIIRGECRGGPGIAVEINNGMVSCFVAVLDDAQAIDMMVPAIGHELVQAFAE